MKQKEMYCHCFSQKVLNLVFRALFITWKYSHACWDFIRTFANPPSFLNSHRGGSSVLGVSYSVVLCLMFALWRGKRSVQCKCPMQPSESCICAVWGSVVGCSRAERGFTTQAVLTCHLFLFGSDVLLSLNVPLHSTALSELPPMKYAGKEKVRLCQLSLHTHVHTLSQTLPAPGNLSAFVPQNLNVCFPLCGQLLPNAQLMFCFMNPLLLWGFIIIILWAKMDPWPCGTRTPAWLAVYMLSCACTLPPLHNYSSCSTENKAFQQNMTAPLNGRSPRLGLAQEKESPGKELLLFDLRAGWAKGKTAECKEGTTAAANWVITAQSCGEGGRSSQRDLFSCLAGALDFSSCHGF